MRTLVLWDIDHTLVDAGNLSREVFAEAFTAVTGRPMGRLADLAGQTDHAIITRTLALNGLDASPELVSAFADCLSAGFAARREAIRARGRPLAGALEALCALAGHRDVVQSVLTGNMRAIAMIKLAAFGLDGFLDLGAGAYGMDDANRAALVRLARERAAARYAEPFGAAAIVLIGDTPSDVAAALEAGVRIVAVATGRSDTKTLRAAGAKVVLPSLEDTASLMRAVLPGWPGTPGRRRDGPATRRGCGSGRRPR